MHRYEELEKIYYKKKFKKIFLYFLFVFISSLAVFSILKLISFNNVKHIKNKAENNITKSIKNNITKRVNKVNITEKNLSTQKNINKKFKNNKTEVKSRINEENNSVFNLSFVLPQIKENKEKKPVSKNPVSKKPVLKANEKNETTKNVQPLIKEKKADLKFLKASFSKFPNYSTAMTIANIYFSKKDLANAKIWALKANNIDPSKYESWKMFAMILLEKNDKIKAKEVLKIYLNNYGENEEITKLLRSINE